KRDWIRFLGEAIVFSFFFLWKERRELKFDSRSFQEEGLFGRETNGSSALVLSFWLSFLKLRFLKMPLGLD
ncbi:hypothetical protein PJI17_31760, partial [Mycobacterium kansasii]